jgi:hypothetical protein
MALSRNDAVDDAPWGARQEADLRRFPIFHWQHRHGGSGAVAAWSLSVFRNLQASGQHAPHISNFDGVSGALGARLKFLFEICASR